MVTRTSNHPNSAERMALSDMRVGTGKRKRPLTRSETEQLVKLYAVKAKPQDFDVMSLAPEGSILWNAAKHFQKSDISYALPIFETVMIASSYLTQNGACLKVSGAGKILPTLWTIGLAESGSSKTLASDEIRRALGGADDLGLVNFPTGSTDAQWIEDLEQHNGSFWFQDEVGKFFQAVLGNKIYGRICVKKVTVQLRACHFLQSNENT